LAAEVIKASNTRGLAVPLSSLAGPLTHTSMNGIREAETARNRQFQAKTDKYFLNVSFH
jgi:hypothetical protein